MALAVKKLVSPASLEGETSVLPSDPVIFPGRKKGKESSSAAKQLLGIQITSGLVKEQFKQLKVVKDVEGQSSVLVAGQARDIFKLALLPNVKTLRLLPVEALSDSK